MQRRKFCSRVTAGTVAVSGLYKAFSILLSKLLHHIAVCIVGFTQQLYLDEKSTVSKLMTLGILQEKVQRLYLFYNYVLSDRCVC